MFCPSARLYIKSSTVKYTCAQRENNERNEYKRTDYGVQKQYWKNSIIKQCLLLAYIIEAQQCC